MRLFTVRRPVGRLIEARVFNLRTTEEVAEYSNAFAPVVAVADPVLCADHRPVVIYPPDVADELVRLFKTMNDRLKRVAILVSRSNATLAMQLQRIVRESNYPSRRVFFDAREAERFLTPILDAPERVRLGVFLGEHADDKPPPAAPSSRRSR